MNQAKKATSGQTSDRSKSSKTPSPKGRILSGMRPSGKLHLGNYVGALENWVQLQKEYECFYFVADWHALTTNIDSSGIASDTFEMVIDWLSAGLDPKQSPLFIQSKIKEHAELYLIFSMLITKGRLERNPTLKDQVRDLKAYRTKTRFLPDNFLSSNLDWENGEDENVTFGHLGYPVLQAADILIYKANVVPVGEDQVPHVEISREIARHFNNQYGEVFPIPVPKLTRFARLPGLDGKKMSKSLGNTILLTDSQEEIQKKVRMAITDPQKVRKNDPGRPEICNVFFYHQKFNPAEEEGIARDCRSGALGCVECKKNCGNKISEFTAPIREKRTYFESHPGIVKEILADGENRARLVAASTINEVRRAMNMG